MKYPEEQLIRPGLLLGAPGQRGGGYSSETTSLRSSNRYYKGQTSQSSTLGFRVCATP